LNFFDYILIGIVGLSMILSLWRGFVREIISIIGLVLAFLAASRLSGMTGDYLSTWITNSTIADIAGFGLVFVLIMLIVGIIGVIIRKLVDMADLTATDRTLGIFFGIARGLLLIGLSFLIYTSYATANDQKWLKESRLTPYGLQMADWLGHVIPEDYPFSRQGSAGKSNNSKTTHNPASNIPIEDQKALDSILKKQMQ